MHKISLAAQADRYATAVAAGQQMGNVERVSAIEAQARAIGSFTHLFRLAREYGGNGSATYLDAKGQLTEAAIDPKGTFVSNKGHVTLRDPHDEGFVAVPLQNLREIKTERNPCPIN